MTAVRPLGVAAVLALAAALASAQTTDLASQAIDAYGAALDTPDRDLRLERFRHAERLFARLVDTGGRNPELYTSLGNAALGAEHLGAAVLAYRRALALDPDYPRALQNLKHARTLLPEWVPRPETGGLLDTFFFWHRTLARSERAFYAASAFALAGLLVALGIRLGTNAPRNLASVPALVWLVLLGSLLLDAGASATGDAVLIADETLARAADSALAPGTLPAPLPDGVEVQILETRAAWLHVRLANGRDAWIPRSAADLVSVDAAEVP